MTVTSELRDRLNRELGDALVVEDRRRRQTGLAALDEIGQRAFADHVLAAAVTGISRERIARGDHPLEIEVEEALRRDVYQSYFLGGRFQRLLELPGVTDIMINGAAHVWLDYADGRRELLEEAVFGDDEELIAEVSRLARTAGRTERRFDAGSPLLVLRLPDGSRLSAMREVSGSPHVAIRRNLLDNVDLDELLGREVIDKGMHSLFTAMMQTGQRTVISGETGAGKTTLTRALLNVLPSECRIVVIEDTKELDVGRDPRRTAAVLEWETRDANIEGFGAIAQRDLVKAALRYNPDWLVVAEVRDGGAAREMVLAMQHGHPSLSTIHHHSAFGAPSKLAQYMAQGQGMEAMPFEIAQRVIADAVDFFIHLARDASGRRVVAEVCEVAGFESGQVQLNRVYTCGHDGRGRPQAHMTDQRRRRLVDAGFDWSLLLNPNGWWES